MTGPESPWQIGIEPRPSASGRDYIFVRFTGFSDLTTLINSVISATLLVVESAARTTRKIIPEKELV
jgi:hypothetical protein